MTTRISYKYGVTLNTGNFESIRIDFMMEHDVEDEADVPRETARVKKYVENVVEKSIDEANTGLHGK